MGTFTTSKQFQLGANLINPWWLSSGASLDLDFRNNRYYDPSLTALKQPLAVLTDYLACSRSSIGYAKTSAGILQRFESNVLRRTDLGLLMEGASNQNLVPASVDFANGSFWSNQNGSTITGNSGVAPDGTMTAVSISNSGAAYMLCAPPSFTLTANTKYTVSLFVKYVSGDPWLELFYGDFSSGNHAEIWFNAQTGAVGSNAATGTGVVNNVNNETLGNGWYRFSVTGSLTADDTVSYGPIYFRLGDSADGATSGTGFSYLIWGAQAEVGTTASSYIPTIDTSATRAADAITGTGNLDSILRGSAASVVADVQHAWGTISPGGTIIDEGGNSPLANGGFNTRIYTSWGGSSVFATLGNSQTLTDGAKVGASIDGTGVSVVGGGGSVANTTTGAHDNQTYFARLAAGTSPSYITLRRLTVWNTRLADATLQGLTNP